MSRRKFLVSLFALVAVWVVSSLSCSGGISKPRTAVEKMFSAYRGAEGLKKLDSFSGYGFMRDLSSRTLARNDPFDIYRSGNRYKHVRYKVVKGKVEDVSIVCYDGENGFEYMYSKGMMDVPEWEFYILKYRFPAVIGWARENLDRAEGIEYDRKDKTCTVRFKNADDIIDITIDAKDGLLRKVRITSGSDSSFSYQERYSDYREVDGIPFPSRFTGEYRGSVLYEFFLPTINLGVELPDTLFKLNAEDTLEIEQAKESK